MKPQCLCDYDDLYVVCPYVLNPELGENIMARTVTAILRDMDTVEKHKRLNEQQKAHALRMFQKELDEATGQGQLDLPPGGQVPVQNGATKAPK